MEKSLEGILLPPESAAFLEGWLAAGRPVLRLNVFSPPEEWDGDKWIPITFLPLWPGEDEPDLVIET